MVDGAQSYDGGPPHGSIGEEAGKLAEAVQEWLGRRTGREPRDVWAAATSVLEDDHAPECRVCPLCRAMRFFSSVNPQVAEHLSDAAASVSAAMRAMAEDRERGRSAPAGDRPGPAAAPHSDGEA
jgi:hypothetical protein